MAARRHSSSAATILAALACALIIHVLVIGGGFLFGGWGELAMLPLSTPVAPAGANAQASADDRPLEIESIVDELAQPARETAEEKAREEEKKKEEEAKHAPGQVVDIAKPAVEQRPDDAKYAAEYDSKVDHEMRGPHGRDQAGARQAMSPTTPPPGAPQPGSPEAAPAGKPGRPGPLAMRDSERVTNAPRGAHHDFGRSPDGDRAPSGEPNALRAPARPQVEPGENGSGRERGATRGGPPGTDRPNLTPTADMLARAIGKGAGSMDYLKDLDDGEATALNAKRWKHAPFFNRLKRQVADQWHPEVVYVRHDPNGNVYGQKDRVTILRVQLHPDGRLASSNVVQSCGVDFLDDEAIDAFRKAAPFPNPPKDLVESDGQIHFSFAFIFELSGRGSLRVFKY